MTDETEDLRRIMLAFGTPQADLEDCQAINRPTWDTNQLRSEFEVIGFAAPFVVVRRREDGAKGSLEFTHSPRIYFNWVEDGR